MLSRLNATTWALAAASVFAFGLVAPTGAKAESPHAGQGPGPTPPPSNPQLADSMAYAVPRNAPSPNVEVVLPTPLPPSAVAQYQRIIALQNAGAFAKADALIDRLDDKTLLGPVLADRYLGPLYRTSPAELADWWSHYSREPEAPAIYGLMQHKMARADLPAAPRQVLLPETDLIPGAAARPVSAPDGAAWHSQFMAGIHAWENNDLAAAGEKFAHSGELVGISDDDRAASEFWAARAALRQHDPEKYLDLLHETASARDSFYGMLASRLLGQGFGPTGISATLTEADIIAVDALPNGHLAFALLQIGETDQATLALRSLWPDIQANPGLGRAVMAVAARAGLVDVAIAIADEMPSPVDEIAGARLPLPPLHPTGGFTVNPALIYALARTESGFNAHAVSHAGARGLMQLMPVTASYVKRHEGISGSLADASDNLAIGQAYIKYLSEQPGIGDNLLAVLASYNAGPGAAAAWYSQLDENSDPLLFIETIPNNETRRFVRQVLADSWLYAEEIGLQPKSLNQLAEGDFPRLGMTNAYLAAAN